MKPVLSIAFLFLFVTMYAQNTQLPPWFLKSFTSQSLDKKYKIAQLLKPSSLQADFNKDGTDDVAVLVTEIATKKQGILIMHGKKNQTFIFGAGTKFGNGGDNFDWASKWEIYNQKTAKETLIDTKTGDILGSNTIKLKRLGILIEDFEDGAVIAGGIIYWNGKEYTWIHQGE